MQLWLRLRRLTTPLRRKEEWLSLGAWVLALALLETAGHDSSSDTVDGKLLAGVALLALVTYRVHGQFGLNWVSYLEQHARAGIKRLRGLETRLGVDFRREPRLRPGTPRPMVLIPALGAAALVGCLLLTAHLPEGLRVLARHAYLPYLMILGITWAALGLGIVMGVALPIATLHDRMAGVLPTGTRRRRSRVAVFALLAAVLLMANWIPARYAAWSAAGLFTVTSLVIASCPVRYDLVWLDGNNERRALTWRRCALSSSLVLGALALTPLLIGLGDELIGAPAADSSLPMTRILARVFAWAALALAVTFLVQLAGFVRLTRRFERARRARPVLRIDGAASDGDLAALRSLGWRLAGTTVERGELRVQVQEGAQVGDALFGPTLPGQVPPGWLAQPSSATRLARRRVQDLRRRVVRGVSRSLRGVAGRKFEQGTGFWITPHLWFARGLTRDKNEAETSEGDPIIEERLGLPWERLMTWEARAYFREVLEALEVDLLFVEDGVGHRRLTQVLRTLFELHDTRGPHRIEERELSLIPGVRVLIQDDAGLDTPLTRGSYPEPDYEDLGRARLMLVFKDRGGDEDPLLEPVDTQGRPVPVAMG